MEEIHLPSLLATSCTQKRLKLLVTSEKAALTNSEGFIDINERDLSRIESNTIEVDTSISRDSELLTERAKRLLERNNRSIESGDGPIKISTTELAFARGAGEEGTDEYISGTQRERLYMMTRSTLKDSELENEDSIIVDIGNQRLRDTDINNIPSPGTAPLRLEVDEDEFLFDGNDSDIEDDAFDKDWNDEGDGFC